MILCLRNILLVICTSFALMTYANPKDSIGIRIINNKRFIAHKIVKNETLFAVARRYNVNVDVIATGNVKANMLKVGDIVFVPITENKTDTEKTNQTIDEAHANADVAKTVVYKHKVAKGETLYRISQLYKVSTQELIKWNNIKDNKIEVGQELIVNPQAAVSPYKPWNRPTTVQQATTANKIPTNNEADEVIQTGIALVTEQNACVINAHTIGGTVLIINLDNNKQVIIKSNTAANQSLFANTFIALLDKRTAAQLDAGDNKNIRVSIKYLSPNK